MAMGWPQAGQEVGIILAIFASFQGFLRNIPMVFMTTELQTRISNGEPQVTIFWGMVFVIMSTVISFHYLNTLEFLICYIKIIA